MRLIFSFSTCISYLTVEGSTGFPQCLGKEPRKREEGIFDGVDIFNWEEPELVQERISKEMSPLYVPAFAIDRFGDDLVSKEDNAYFNKMILDTGSELSRFHPIGCKRSSHRSVEVGFGLQGAFVDAKVDCSEPFRSGRIGIGPGSPFMNRVYKLELTIKGGKYRNLRLGADLHHSGYTFADIVTHERYPEAWAVEGFLMENKYGAKRRVTIIFKTCSTPRLVSNTKVSRLLIPVRSPTEPHKKKEESFSLRGDQFIDFADDVILVNPIVLGTKKDIGILFDSGSSRILKPRMGFKVKPKST